MAIHWRGKAPDPLAKQILDALKLYQQNHAQADIEAYRQNSVSVRIRVLNPEFAGRSRAQREDEVWDVLNQLSEETAAEISQLLLYTPDEAKQSFANFEFDKPIPSKL